MPFNSIIFFTVFLVTLIIYYCLKHNWQNKLLLGVSLFIYGYWDFRFLILLLISTVISYFCAYLIRRSCDQKLRKKSLIFGLFINLLILGFFKYFSFFFQEFSFALSKLGIKNTPMFYEIILPIGISFYTFQNLSYIIDIYRNKIKSHYDLQSYVLYIVFFPQLVAGPIERATHLLPQITAERHLHLNDMKKSFWFLLYGYFQKVVVADNLAPFVRSFFSQTREYQGPEIIFFLLAGAFLVYADFSGYSKIAQGLAGFLGFKLSTNFREPTLSVSILDFFQRWNITVTRWFRDYLGVWLATTGINKSTQILVVTSIIGLWHGASWKFLIWGLINGILIIINKILAPFKLYEKSTRLIPFLRHIWPHLFFFFVLVPLTSSLFFVKNLDELIVIFHRIFYPSGNNWKLILATLVSFVPMMLMIDLFADYSKDQAFVIKWPFIGQLCLYTLLFLTILLSGDVGTYEFIYFQF
jgi:alginate O-acetyltransferase complex protein AlgI